MASRAKKPGAQAARKSAGKAVDKKSKATRGRMTPAQILAEIDANFKTGKRQKFLPGLLLAFIHTLQKLDAVPRKFASLADFYKVHPQRTEKADGGGLNTWVVWLDAKKTTPKDKSLSIRGAYDKILAYFRFEKRRFDYPSSAPHSTQGWVGYTHWIDALLTFDEAQLKQLEEAAKQYVLDNLEERKVDLALVKREPPVFFRFLTEFDFRTTNTGEKTGAAYQAAVFGYLRADASHLQVDVGKVRTGSKRVGRIGDIDARDGELLVMAAEVKQYTLPMKEVPTFKELADQVGEQGGLGLVVALEFGDGVREAVAKLGLEPMSLPDLTDRVRVWDAVKQRNAIQALRYCIFYKEQSTVLHKRVVDFIAEIEAEPTEVVVVAAETDGAAPAAPVPAAKTTAKAPSAGAAKG